MESSPTPHAPRGGVSLVGALGGMLITFLIGVYVGIHPNWIPIKTTPESNDSTAAPLPMPDVSAPPATMPSTMPSYAPPANAATQPSPPPMGQ
jgi:hypothetical protein